MELGTKFKTLNDFYIGFDAFKQRTLNEYSIRNCKTLKFQKEKYPNTVKNLDANAEVDLLYYNVKFTCIQGGRNYEEKKGRMRTSEKKTKTIKKGCPASMVLKLSPCNKFLVITEINDSHNHESSMASFRAMHQQRLKLDESTKDQIKSFLAKDCNKNLLKEEIVAKTGCHVTLKDLTNFKRNNTEEDLEGIVNLLKHSYNCNVELLVMQVEDESSLHALFFQDQAMLDSFYSFPEVLIMDRTYCLDNRASFYLLMVEDSNGHSEVVAACFIFEENFDNLNWFLSTFKTYNEAWKNTKCVITDKDSKKHESIRNNFPNVKLLICIFHCMQIFKREISGKGMQISSEDCNLSLEFLQKLAYCGSEDEYELLYDDFVKKVPKCVLDYYNKNWHPIKEEWVMAFTFKYNSFDNKTNNHLKAFHQKLKTVSKRHSRLEDVIKGFFIDLNSLRNENDIKAVQSLNKVSTSREKNDTMIKYENLLTSHAFTFVANALNEKKTEENFTFVGDSTYIYKSVSGIWQVSVDACECLSFINLGLPCAHIFHVRKCMELPLYEEALCLERWRKTYYFKHQRKANIIENEIGNISIKKRKEKFTLTSQQKFKVLSEHCLKLSQLGSEVSTDRFNTRLNTIKMIIELWSRGTEVDIIAVGSAALDTQVDSQLELMAIDVHTRTSEMEVECDSASMPVHADVHVDATGDTNNFHNYAKIKEQ